MYVCNESVEANEQSAANVCVLSLQDYYLLHRKNCIQCIYKVIAYKPPL